MKKVLLECMVSAVVPSHFAILHEGSEHEELVIVNGSGFASAAWRRDDDSFKDVSARSFGITDSFGVDWSEQVHTISYASVGYIIDNMNPVLARIEGLEYEPLTLEEWSSMVHDDLDSYIQKDWKCRIIGHMYDCHPYFKYRSEGNCTRLYDRIK